jgi:hypothetical protein
MIVVRDGRRSQASRPVQVIWRERLFWIPVKQRKAIMKKLMLLATGALIAFAFAALPAISSAGEFEAHCEGAAKCEGTITTPAGGFFELENNAGQRIRCTELSGSTSFTSTTKTGTATLDFGNCREQETIFKFQCTTPGMTAGTILVSNLTYHLVNLNDPLKGEANTPGIAFTSVNSTFVCAGGFENKTVTGNVLGRVENACSSSSTTTSVNFEAGVVTGEQKYMQITKTGAILDLTSGPHSPDTSTSSQIGTGIIHWSKPVKITC